MQTLIDASGVVVNLMPEIPVGWTPPPGYTLGPQGGKIGDTWDGAAYRTPLPPGMTIEDLKSMMCRDLRHVMDNRAKAFAYESFAGVANNPGLAKAADRSLEDTAGLSQSDADLIAAARQYMGMLAPKYGQPDASAMARALLSANDHYTIRRGLLEAELHIGVTAINAAADAEAIKAAAATAAEAIQAVQ